MLKITTEYKKGLLVDGSYRCILWNDDVKVNMGYAKNKGGKEEVIGLLKAWAVKTYGDEAEVAVMDDTE